MPALVIVAPWFWAALLEIVLLIAVIVRGRVGGAWIATVIALILNTVLLLVLFGWLTFPACSRARSVPRPFGAQPDARSRSATW